MIGFFGVGVITFLSAILGDILFPKFFGISESKGAVLFDGLFFCLVFLYNNVVIQQTKYADEKLHRSYKGNRMMLLVCLFIYACLNLFNGYDSMYSGLIIAFAFSGGFQTSFIEADYNQSCLTARKEQLVHLQDLRELNRYVHLRMDKLEKIKILKGRLTVKQHEKMQNYKKLLESSEKEYNYLHGVLKKTDT